ncbi:platelet-derived growth factor D isoform X1, partial [Tachysurus ichikawai]
MSSVAVICRAARLLALALVCSPLVSARGAQVRADKPPRATNTRRDSGEFSFSSTVTRLTF